MSNVSYILAANLLIWFGIFALVMRIDRKVSSLEEKCRKES